MFVPQARVREGRLRPERHLFPDCFRRQRRRLRCRPPRFAEPGLQHRPLRVRPGHGPQELPGRRRAAHADQLQHRMRRRQRLQRARDGVRQRRAGPLFDQAHRQFGQRGRERAGAGVHAVRRQRRFAGQDGQPDGGPSAVLRRIFPIAAALPAGCAGRLRAPAGAREPREGAAAQAGATAGAAEHGTTDDCVRTATDLASRAGDSLAGLAVTCQIRAATVTATVTGNTLSLVPGWEPTTTQTATVPREEIS